MDIVASTLYNMPMGKNKSDRARLDRLCEMGCIVCRNLGAGYVAAEIHHMRSGMGVSMRNDDRHTIALCAKHHRNGGYGEAYHSGASVWQARFGTEQQLLEQSDMLLANYDHNWICGIRPDEEPIFEAGDLTDGEIGVILSSEDENE